jgi:hypothetical protein
MIVGLYCFRHVVGPILSELDGDSHASVSDYGIETLLHSPAWSLA